MKNLRTATLCISVMFYSLCSLAQNGKPPINEPNYRKPRLFENLPNTIPVTVEDMNNLISKEVGLPVSLRLSAASNSLFDGEVVSTENVVGNGLKSVVIRSSNFNGARLTLSKVITAEGEVTFVGRIISFQHGDLYELEKQDGQFVLVKKNYYDLVNE